MESSFSAVCLIKSLSNIFHFPVHKNRSKKLVRNIKKGLNMKIICNVFASALSILTGNTMTQCWQYICKQGSDCLKTMLKIGMELKREVF